MIRNSGTRPLTVSDIFWDSLYDPWFEVQTDFAGPQTLDRGDSLVINVLAIINVPTENDTVLLNGNVSIASDDPLDPLKYILLEAETVVLGTQTDPPGIITESRLLGNYPNPFNPITVISWQLAVNSPVRLTIYTIRGEKVATLVNQSLPAGTHTAEWDAGGIASGVYLYRLEAGGFVETRKMMLMK